MSARAPKRYRPTGVLPRNPRCTLAQLGGQSPSRRVVGVELQGAFQSHQRFFAAAEEVQGNAGVGMHNRVVRQQVPVGAVERHGLLVLLPPELQQGEVVERLGVVRVALDGAFEVRCGLVVASESQQGLAGQVVCRRRRAGVQRAAALQRNERLLVALQVEQRGADADVRRGEVRIDGQGFAVRGERLVAASRLTESLADIVERGGVVRLRLASSAQVLLRLGSLTPRRHQVRQSR